MTEEQEAIILESYRLPPTASESDKLLALMAKVDEILERQKIVGAVNRIVPQRFGGA